MQRIATAAAMATLALTAGPALAHHSYAMFDRDKNLTLTGTVQEFKWTNPHSWIALEVPNGQGGMDQWGVECTSPAVFVKAGWKSTTLKPGDQVTVTIHPLRSGEKGGAFVSVQFPDGRVMTDRPAAT